MHRVARKTTYFAMVCKGNAKVLSGSARGGLFADCGYCIFELEVRLLDGLGDDADVADDGHEIDVAIPAGDDVGMDVSGDAGAGAFADVDADVEALGIHCA